MDEMISWIISLFLSNVFVFIKSERSSSIAKLIRTYFGAHWASQSMNQIQTSPNTAKHMQNKVLLHALQERPRERLTLCDCD